MRYIALDFETSGLDPSRHAPVQLGVALFDEGRPVATMEAMIQPPVHYKTGRTTREYDATALEISGLTLDQLRQAHPANRVVFDLAQFAIRHKARYLPIVAFNASFDLAFYSTLLFLAGEYDRHAAAFRPATPPLIGPWHCARMLAQATVPTLPDHKLDTVAARYGLKRTGEKHGALEDAVLAGLVHWAINEGRGSDKHQSNVGMVPA